MYLKMWGCFSSIKLLASSEYSSLHSSHLPFCNVNTYSLSNCKLSFVIMFMKGREKFYQSEGVRRNWTLKFAVTCGKWKWKVLGKVANWKLEALLFQFFIEIEIEWVKEGHIIFLKFVCIMWCFHIFPWIWYTFNGRNVMHEDVYEVSRTKTIKYIFVMYLFFFDFLCIPCLVISCLFSSLLSFLTKWHICLAHFNWTDNSLTSNVIHYMPRDDGEFLWLFSPPTAAKQHALDTTEKSMHE